MPTLTLSEVWPLVLLTVLPLVWLLAWRFRAGGARSRVSAAAVLRSAALVAIIAALMRPVLHRASEEVSVVYALDISGSVSRRFLNEALEWITQVDARHRPARSRIVAFADRAELLESVGSVRDLALASGNTPSGKRPIDPGATDLEEGLLATLPGFAAGHAKRIVLLSDGNQTEGDVWRAMLRLQAEGVRVFGVPASVSAEKDAWVEQIIVPQGVREGAMVEIEARVFSLSSVLARVGLTIGERSAASRTVALSPGDNRVSMSARFPHAGGHTVTVRVSAEGDQMPRNDTLTEEVRVLPRPHVLYVEGSERSAQLTSALTAQGIRVSAATPEALSKDARLLLDKDAVILSDVRSESLGPEFVGRLRTFVRDRGGGLIFAAGQNTYGKEGYAKSEIEQLLPVTFESKRKQEDLDLVLLVDRSSSMRGQKIEVSKSAALATLDLLDAEHRMAVVAFDAKPHDIVPLVPVGDKREAESLLSRMTSSGQTNIYNALLRAQELLAGSQAHTKHIILLSDGLTAPPPGAAPARFYPTEIEQRLREVQVAEARQRGGAAEPPQAPQVPALARDFPGIMEELTAAKITLSTVAIGEKPDVELMANLAKWGSGKSYVTRSDAEVPTLFAAETHRLLGDSIVEESFRPRVLGRSPSIAGIDFATGPQLKGYVASKRKRFSDVLLEAKKDLPLLAETHYGLGKTVAFLSDVNNRWAADWLRWPGYAKFWAQLVRDGARRESGEGLSWRVVREGDNAIVELSAFGHGGSFRHDLWPEVRATAPNGRSTVAVLRQVAPGRYLTQVPLVTADIVPWRFELLAGPGIKAADVTRAGGRSLFYSHSDEYRLLPVNLPLLRNLSERTGGLLAPAAEEIFRLRGDGGLVATPLWTYCAGAALLLFLLDILARRAPWRWRRTTKFSP